MTRTWTVFVRRGYEFCTEKCDEMTKVTVRFVLRIVRTRVMVFQPGGTIWVQNVLFAGIDSLYQNVIHPSQTVPVYSGKLEQEGMEVSDFFQLERIEKMSVMQQSGQEFPNEGNISITNVTDVVEVDILSIPVQKNQSVT